MSKIVVLLITFCTILSAANAGTMEVQSNCFIDATEGKEAAKLAEDTMITLSAKKSTVNLFQIEDAGYKLKLIGTTNKDGNLTSATSELIKNNVVMGRAYMLLNLKKVVTGLYTTQMFNVYANDNDKAVRGFCSIIAINQ